eukprot:8542266-Karenia_brevis.AAC.1
MSDLGDVVGVEKYDAGIGEVGIGDDGTGMSRFWGSVSDCQRSWSKWFVMKVVLVVASGDTTESMILTQLFVVAVVVVVVLVVTLVVEHLGAVGVLV